MAKLPPSCSECGKRGRMKSRLLTRTVEDLVFGRDSAKTARESVYVPRIPASDRLGGRHDTPVTYRVPAFLKRVEDEDWYDRTTDFNPFRIRV